MTERALPDTWKVLNMMPLPAEIVRGFFPDDVDVEVVDIDPRTEEQAIELAPGCHIVVGDYEFKLPVSADVINALDDCRLIQQPSAGYQQIDISAAAAKGIPVASVGGANAVAVAEHTIMSALALMKQMVWVDAQVREGHWVQMEVGSRGHYELAGKAWGIVGFGRIGREVATRLKGWDVTVRYFDVVKAPPEVEDELEVSFAEVDDLFEQSDVISLHAPLTEQTRHIVDAAAFDRMKDTAYLVNVARGELIDEEALLDALRNGKIHAAAIDVFAEEPLPAAHPLTELDNILLSPHTAGTPQEARSRIINAARDNLARVVHGEPPLHVVNGVEV